MVALRRKLMAGALALIAVSPAAAGAVGPIGGLGGAAAPRPGLADAHYAGVYGTRSHHGHGPGWGLLDLFNFPSYFATPEDVRPWWSYYPPQPVWDGSRLIWLAPRFPRVACSEYLPPYSPGACPP